MTGPNALKKEEQLESAISDDQVKVKVTHAWVSDFDANVICGNVNARYPVTPGRAAIGIVTEAGANCYGIEPNERVFLEAARNCGRCYACKSGEEKECADVKIAGRDFDGFIRDFAVCRYSDVTVLPDSVDDMHALCIEAVGLAEKIYDRLSLSAGQRIAIVGGSFLGNIMAQVLQYHKIIPIVIDNNAQNLEKARRAGVYYTFANDDELQNNIADATCGELCDGAIFNTGSRLSPSVATRVIANRRNVILGGFSGTNFKIEAQDIVSKNLSLCGISDGYGYTGTAINMLIHGAINLDVFDKEVLTEFDLNEIIKNKLNDLKTGGYSKMTVLKMIF